MTWLEVLYANRPGSFIRLEGGTLDIGIGIVTTTPSLAVGFDLADLPPAGLFAETFEALLPTDH